MDFFPQTRKNISDLWEGFTDDRNQSKVSTMKTDIYEKEGNLILETELPGFYKEDISVDYKNEHLIITAKNSYKNEIEDKRYIKKERSYGEYIRRFFVDGVKKDEIAASFTDGILKITIPRPIEKHEFKTINID